MTDSRETLTIRAPDFRLWASPEYADRVRQNGLVDARACDSLEASGHRVAGGRGGNLLLEAGDWGETIRLRPSRHGGWLAALAGDRYLSPQRVRRELELGHELRRRNVPVALPAFALGRRRRLLWRTSLATREIEHSSNGFEWLETNPSEAALFAAGDALAGALRRFHDAGAIHGDLHLRNLLLEFVASDPTRDPTACWLVDLDRAHIVDRVRPAQRMREWMRLARSFEKLGLSHRISQRLCDHVLDRYCNGDEDLHRRMLAHLPRETRRLRRHRFAWRLGRILRPALALMLSLGLGLLTTACSPESTPALPGGEGVRHSLFAVGDTGRTRSFAGLFEGQLSVADAMTREARRRPVDELVLLGDNFYWNGLDRENLVPRIKENLVRPYCHFLRLDGPRSSEVEEACPEPRADRSPIPVFAVLGNHDLQLPESPRLQREVVPEFLPGWQMSRELAQVFELGDGLSLILFESEPSINDPEAIAKALEEALGKARGPWRILATHRPIATDDFGNHRLGGYPDFVRKPLAAAGVPVQLVLAGHHHNLQIFEVGAPIPSLQVGIGGGSRAEPPLARDHPDSRFGRIAIGFARIDLIGDAQQERLAVTLFQAPRWPILAWLSPARPVARFEVDPSGRVYSSPAD